MPSPAAYSFSASVYRPLTASACARTSKGALSPIFSTSSASFSASVTSSPVSGSPACSVRNRLTNDCFVHPTRLPGFVFALPTPGTAIFVPVLDLISTRASAMR